MRPGAHFIQRGLPYMSLSCTNANTLNRRVTTDNRKRNNMIPLAVRSHLHRHKGAPLDGSNPSKSPLWVSQQWFLSAEETLDQLRMFVIVWFNFNCFWRKVLYPPPGHQGAEVEYYLGSGGLGQLRCKSPWQRISLRILYHYARCLKKNKFSVMN